MPGPKCAPFTASAFVLENNHKFKRVLINWNLETGFGWTQTRGGIKPVNIVWFYCYSDMDVWCLSMMGFAFDHNYFQSINMKLKEVFLWGDCGVFLFLFGCLFVLFFTLFYFTIICLKSYGYYSCWNIFVCYNYNAMYSIIFPWKQY